MDLFILPCEAREFLKAILSNGLKLLLEAQTGPIDIGEANLTNIIMEFDSSQNWQPQIIIWDSNIVKEPRFREINTIHGNRIEVDFLHTGGVLFEPSIIIRPNVLLEGRIAILKKSEYERVGMDATIIKTLYNRVLKELKRLSASDAKVFLKLTDGNLSLQRRELASSGALEWYNKGRLLKQFYQGPAEFCISPIKGK